MKYINPNWAIGFVVVISVMHYSVVAYAGHDPSIRSELLMRWSLMLMFTWWALEDAKKQKYHRPYEFGAFIFFGWPIILPAYLIATRGWRGILTFLAFVLLSYLPPLTGWVVYVLNSENY